MREGDCLAVTEKHDVEQPNDDEISRHHVRSRVCPHAVQCTEAADGHRPTKQQPDSAATPLAEPREQRHGVPDRVAQPAPSAGRLGFEADQCPRRRRAAPAERSCLGGPPVRLGVINAAILHSDSEPPNSPDTRANFPRA